MKNDGVPIVREGYPFLAVFALASFGLFLGGYIQFSLVAAAITAYVAYFFRNPERLVPIGATVVASPADGKVISVGRMKDFEFTQVEMQRISIFMSLFDVHVNRVPIDGNVKDLRYHKGRFLAAFEERACEENERSAMLLETSRGEKVVMVQIAGLIARRIISYPVVGNFLLKGQRMGLIRFGSRCDLYLPVDAEILVKAGDRVLGGETILAKLKES